MEEKRIRALKKLIEGIIAREKPGNVAELVKRVRSRHKVETQEAIEVIRSLEEEGRIDLYLPPLDVSSYAEYIRIRSENNWFYLVLLAVLGTLASIYLLPEELPLVAIRWVLGCIFVLCLPGFVTIQALFPGRRDLGDIERFVLSICLSIAITPLIGLVLNYTPWGIRLKPVVASLSAFTAATGFVATYRKFQLAAKGFK